MATPIKFRIRGGREGDAPTVEDFVDQLRDLIGIIEGIEAALDGGAGAVEWRVTQASMNSPIAIEATPFPKQFGVNIDARVSAVKTAAASGLHSLLSDRVRPTYFNQAVLGSAKRIADRVTKGLTETAIDWGDEADSFSITPRTAQLMSGNAAAVLKPRVRSYDERGTLEGYHDGIQRHPQGQPQLFVRSRRTGDRVKCILTDAAYEDIRHREIEDVLRGRRIQVRGTLHYKGPHQLDSVTAESVRVMPGKEALPSVDEIVDRNFTGGLGTEDYLEALRGRRAD